MKKQGEQETLFFFSWAMFHLQKGIDYVMALE
jgi:hypothetical protein